MRIGVCTTDFATHPTGELFKKMSSMGFESTQLGFVTLSEMNYIPTGQIEIPESIPDDVIRLVREASSEYGIPVCAINGTFNAAHPDAEVRAEGIRRFAALANAASKLNCHIITLCSGTRNTDDLWAEHADNGTAEAWADCIETMRALSDIAQEHGITLAVETEAANIIDTPAKARRMMDEVGSPHLKMIMDCANLFRKGEAYMPNVAARLREAFDAFGGDVVVAHGKDIAESDGIAFCPTGEGIIDFELFVKLLSKCGYEGEMMLHGIYDEAKMPAGIELIRQAMSK